MNLMIQPNQICLIVKLYNYRPELLPDSNDLCTKNDIMIIKLIELNNFKGFEDIQIPLNEKINGSMHFRLELFDACYNSYFVQIYNK